MLTFDRVSFAYRAGKPVLSDLSFSLRRGERLTVMGESGCGKSTLLSLAAGLLMPTAGHITRRAERVACIFQEPRLFPWLSVAENLAAVLPRPDPFAIASVLCDVGLSDCASLYPAELSGGMKSRVSLARGLLFGGDLYLLDEPFAAIDAKVRTELRTWLKEMVEKLGITSIFVTHDQDEAVEVADEIIITNHGQIEQMGSPMEIYKTPSTPFVAQFIGRSTVVEDYEKLKGFDRVPGADRAVIRPEFVKISKSGRLDQYQSAAESGIVKDVLFRGSHLDVTVDVNGVEIVAERSMEKDVVKPGEQVHVLIYRLYVFDENQTYLLENKAMQDNDVFYI